MSVRRMLIPGAIVLLGVLLSVLACQDVKQRQIEAERSAMERHAVGIIAALNSELQVNMEILQGINALYRASTRVTRQEFATYTDGYLQRYPSIQALSCLVLVVSPVAPG